MVDLLYVAMIFFVVAIISYLMGARGFAWFTADLAKFLIWVFVILALITLFVRIIPY